jgi:hypothetical protein
VSYLLVGLLGFAVGILTSVAWIDALHLYRSSRKERVMPTRNHTVNRWLLTFVLVVNGAIGGFLIYQRAQAEEFTRCTAEWQSDFYDAYRPRSQAIADTLVALDGVVSSVAKQDRTEFDRALDEYQRIRRQQVAERKATPLPELPENACGEVKR